MVGTAPALAGAAPAQTADETYPTLTVGPDTFTNVTILSKTRTDIFVRHKHGMANLKVHDLDASTQMKLGYQVEQPKGNPIQQVMQMPAIAGFEADPDVQEIEERLLAGSEEWLERVDEQVYYYVTGGVILFYLIFSFLCRLICVKTSNPPSPLIWLPLVKQIPLFKAAGMSPGWLLSIVIPPLYFVAYIIWCFKIVRARAKKPIYAIMLLLPVTNVLAFLYLALSGDGTEKEPSNPNVINLGNPPAPRREAI